MSRESRQQGSGGIGRPRLRIALDLMWVAAFAASLSVMLLRSSGASAPAAGMKLELMEGEQRQGLYRRQERIGHIDWTVSRRSSGWKIRQRFTVGGQEAARFVLELRRDLSLSFLGIEADMGRLARISGVPPLLLRSIGGVRHIELKGACDLETGDCSIKGKIGRRTIALVITAGRGPVVTSAIYPLLARGSLGREAELKIFDPLSLRQRVVKFTVEGQEELRLRSGAHRSIRVLRDLDGLATRVWIDPTGRVLKEELPMGFTTEHERWTAP